MPAWRHALINYPHPLLQQGLVVLDTPGLNAIGAEPELTLGLLPSAHATVFILGADTGVTRSDMTIWRDHLGAHAPTRFIVLNKIDALDDPLATPEEVQAQIAAAAAGNRAHARRPPVRASFRCRRGRRSPRASPATTPACRRAGCLRSKPRSARNCCRSAAR